MGTRRRHIEALKQVLLRHADLKPSHGSIDTLAVFDDERQVYTLVEAGWNLGARVHSMLFLARIIDGRIRLEWDGIGYGITGELIDAGIAEEDIILAWMEGCPPEAADHSRRERTILKEPSGTSA